MPRPTRVTILSSEYIGVKISNENERQIPRNLGFVADELSDRLYFYEAPKASAIYRMCERLRDSGVPFSTHRTGGADYVVEVFRSRGHLQGRFKRINFFGNDTDEDAQFAIEEF